jgi:hypothetical protein
MSPGPDCENSGRGHGTRSWHASASRAQSGRRPAPGPAVRRCAAAAQVWSAQMAGHEEIPDIAEFRRRRSEGKGVFVIVGRASGRVLVHHVSCPFMTDQAFSAKMVRRSGRKGPIPVRSGRSHRDPRFRGGSLPASGRPGLGPSSSQIAMPGGPRQRRPAAQPGGVRGGGHS